MKRLSTQCLTLLLGYNNLASLTATVCECVESCMFLFFFFKSKARVRTLSIQIWPWCTFVLVCVCLLMSELFWQLFFQSLTIDGLLWPWRNSGALVSMSGSCLNAEQVHIQRLNRVVKETKPPGMETKQPVWYMQKYTHMHTDDDVGEHWFLEVLCSSALLISQSHFSKVYLVMSLDN